MLSYPFSANWILVWHTFLIKKLLKYCLLYHLSLSLSRWDIWMTMPPSSNWKSSTTQTYCMCLEVGKRMMLFFTSKIKMRLNTPARILLSGNLRRTCVFKDDRYELLKKISQCMVTAFCSALPPHVGFYLTALSWGTVYAIGGCLWKKLLKPCFDNLLVVVLTWLSNLLTALFFSVWLVLV